MDAFRLRVPSGDIRAGFGPAIGPCLYLCIDIIDYGKPVSDSASGCRVVHCCAYLGLYEMMGGGLLFYCMRLATGSFLVGRVSGFCGVVKVSSYGLDSGVCEVVYESQFPSVPASGTNSLPVGGFRNPDSARPNACCRQA